MAWKMYHCPHCDNWQSAKVGKVCLKCNSTMEMTEYVDEEFPPTEDFFEDSSIGINVKTGVLEKVEHKPVVSEETESPKEEIKEEVPKTEVEQIVKGDDQLYRMISGISEDVHFIANVLRAYIALCIIGLTIYIIMLAVNS